MNQIQARHLKADHVYYSNYPIPPPIYEIDQAGRRIENPRGEWPNDGYAVACSALVFLIKLETNAWSPAVLEAHDMVNWLTSQRNHVSGFTSTFVCALLSILCSSLLIFLLFLPECVCVYLTGLAGGSSSTAQICFGRQESCSLQDVCESEDKLPQTVGATDMDRARQLLHALTYCGTRMTANSSFEVFLFG